MRPRIIAAVAALIAASALVALPGPAGSTPQSPLRAVSPAEFEIVAADVVDGARVTATALDPANASAGQVTATTVFGDEGVVPGVPSARPVLNQPGAVIAAVAKPRPRTPPATSTTRTTSGRGGWHYDPNVSWYGPGFYGRRTACGLAYTKTILGVAHKTLPCGTKVTFRNPKNGRTLTVRVIDRGPYVAGRQWDLSGGLCVALDHCYTGPIQWKMG